MADRQRKRPVNLSVNEDLLAEAREFEINLSQALESGLRATLKLEREKRWLAENRPAIEAYNRRVSKDGLLSDEAGLL